MIPAFIGEKRWKWKIRWTIPARMDHPDPEKSTTLPQCLSCLFRRLDSESVLSRTKSGRVTLSSKTVRANANVAKLCQNVVIASDEEEVDLFVSSTTYSMVIRLFFLRDLNWLITLTFSERQHKIQTTMKSPLITSCPVFALHSFDFKKDKWLLCPSSSHWLVEFYFLYCEPLWDTETPSHPPWI